MFISTEGLVLREKDIGENDRLITILTRELGVVSAFASGVKSVKSKRGSATSLLSFSSFQLQKKKDTYRVSEAVSKHIFLEVGDDLTVLSVAQYFCELAELLAPRESEANTVLRLLLNSLHFLTKEKRDPYLMKAITELRLAALSGYCPDLVACSSCGKFEDDIMYFNPADGSLLCSDCKMNGGMELNRTCVSAMRHIVYSQFGRLYSFDIPENDAKLLSNVTERYVLYQTDHRFLTLDFIHSLG